MAMNDQRLGSAIRHVRVRRRLRQADLAAAAGVSRSSISLAERGHVGGMSVDTVRKIAAALDLRIDLVARWRGGELDRLFNARHSALHEAVARWFRAEMPSWILRPEVSFSIYGERGIVDIVAWHPPTRALAIVELKTDVVDVNQLLGSVDRKRRLGPRIARDLGWSPTSVSAWVIVAPSRTNRRRIAAHGAVLRSALPADGRTIRAWLADPVGRLDALSVWPNASHTSVGTDLAPIRRVRPRRSDRGQ
jgi:transcriptional regulator with XRE-family HTH domain